jgi:hypothetical protein
MKKSFIFYPLLIFSTVFSQQVELINDWDEAAVPEGLFAPSSPYRLSIKQKKNIARSRKRLKSCSARIRKNFVFLMTRKIS